MKHQEGFFKNHKDQSIYYQTWLPETKIKGKLLLVHGLHEHSGRYSHFADTFTKYGYAVYGLDFPGHGKSAGVRSYVDSFEDFTETLLIFLNWVRGEEPDKPVFLIGHSLGGLITAVFLLDHQELVRGAVISGGLVKVPDYVTNLTLQAGKLLSFLVPKFRILGIDIDGISRDSKVVQAYRDDPLVYTGKMTARISNAMNNAIIRLAEEGSAIQLPLLLLHGSEDRLCDPAWSAYLRDLVSSQDKQLIIYDEYYHEIYNEPGKEKVFQDVLAWLDKHVS